MSVHLVTGGLGFIGSHLVDRLLADLDNEHYVRVLDNESTGHQENCEHHRDNPFFEWYQGSVADPNDVHQAMEGVSHVYHLAALGSVPRSIEEPLESQNANVHGTLILLEEARERKVQRFVFASSSAVYGTTYHNPRYEELPMKAASPYGLTKLAAERWCTLYHELYGVPVVALRFFNVFGPRQRAGGPYAAVIPAFIDALLSDKPIRVNGSTNITRDFTYVDKVVDACMRAATSERAVGKSLNVAEGTERSLNEVLLHLCRILGKRIEDLTIDALPFRPGDLMRSGASTYEMEAALGKFEPRGFIEDLEATVAWQKEYRP